jgi:iron complex outermembrane receptor protein
VSLILNAMYEDAKTQQAATPQAIGTRPENTPEFTASAFVEYRPNIGFLDSNLGLTAGVQYVGNRAIDSVSGIHELFVPAYTLLDLGARYSFHWSQTALTLRAKVDNVTDKRYWAGTGADYLSQGLPRTAKVTLETQF